MPKLVTRPPKYARHKPGGQAIAGINGRMIYLGPWGSEKSRTRYKQEVTKWADDQERSPTAPVTAAELLPESSTTLVLLAECLDHAEGRGKGEIFRGALARQSPFRRRTLRR
jgi:hypothetical protein